MYACMYIGGSPRGWGTIGHSRPRGEVQLPLPLYGPISVCTRLVEVQLPSNRRKAKLPPLYPGMVTVAPGGVPATLLYTGVCTTLVVGFL